MFYDKTYYLGQTLKFYNFMRLIEFCLKLKKKNFNFILIQDFQKFYTFKFMYLLYFFSNSIVVECCQLI